jgi:hypothetical protein
MLKNNAQNINFNYILASSDRFFSGRPFFSLS